MIDEVQPTVLPVVPALASSLARLYKALKKTESNIRLITNTGGHLSGTTIEILAKTFPESNIVPMYGLTECKRALYLAPHLVKDKPTSVGGPMPGLMATVFTMSDDGQRLEAPPGEVGELYVRGPSVMQGYHSDDVEGGARLIKGRYRDDNWLATGDLFSTDDDGLLYFRGRAKALIKQGGYCIFPGDIERIVEKKQDVIAAKVVSGEDENGDEMAVLFIQAAAEADKERKKALIEDIKAGINKTLMPKRVLFVDEWPSTPNGKIDAEALTSLARTK
jgi:acyl-CoA synthetase (AMP-forming)/AMP-acid ligase II